MNKDTDLIFYNFGSKKIDFSTAKNLFNRPIALSKGFNKALKSVIEKDINFLSRKVKKIVNEINLWINDNVSDFNKINYDINELDSIINSVNELKKCINDKKKNNKVGVFSSNKKSKKETLKNLDLFYTKLDSYLISLEAIKTEYNKLTSKKNSISEDNLDNNKDEISDPLERTISFYMNQNK